MIKNNESSSFNRLFQGLLMAALVAVGIANLYLLLQDRDGKPAEEEQYALANPTAAYDATRTPVFVSVGPLTVNLQSDGYGQRLLYIGLSLQVPDLATRELLTQHMPEVQSRLLMLLSGQNADELIPAAGKQKLTEQIVTLFQTPLAQTTSPVAINAVLFTNFIVQ